MGRAFDKIAAGLREAIAVVEPEPTPDVTSITLHAGERGDWPIPWAGLTVPRGKSLRLVRNADGRWVEARE